MNWFKHYANMATDERMMRMECEMGYIGTGIFWRAMELINGMGGSYPLKGLLYTIKNRHAKQGKVMQVIMGYGLFEVDSVGLVRFCEVSKRALAEPSQLPNGTASEDAIIGTRVVEREEREKESPSDSPVEVVANDDDRRGSPCGYPNETENTHHGAPTRDAPTVDDKESPIIHELRTNRSWQEAVCITSGYGALLMRHFDRAVDIFLQHVRAGADEVELSDRRRAMNYFRNFTRLSHPAGRRLKEELERADIPNGPHPSLPGPHPSLPQGEGVDSMARHSTPLPCGGAGGGSAGSAGASPFEDPPGPNGERSYHGGRPLPPDAPPRPSPQAEWDEAEGKWWEGWTLPPAPPQGRGVK